MLDEDSHRDADVSIYRYFLSDRIFEIFFTTRARVVAARRYVPLDGCLHNDLAPFSRNILSEMSAALNNIKL